MGKHWVREEIRKNWLAEKTEIFLSWLKNHKNQALGGTAIIAAVLLGGYYNFSRISASETSAWEALHSAQKLIYKAEFDRAITELDKLNKTYPKRKASAYAMLLKADILYGQDNYKQAEQAYQLVINKANSFISPLAYSGLCASFEAQKNYKNAILTAENFIKKYPNHFLKPQIYFVLAHSHQAAKNIKEAKTYYEKTYTMFPNTYWGQSAKENLELLKKQ